MGQHLKEYIEIQKAKILKSNPILTQNDDEDDDKSEYLDNGDDLRPLN